MREVHARVSDLCAERGLKEGRAPAPPSAVDEHASPRRGLDHKEGSHLLGCVVDPCQLKATGMAHGFPSVIGQRLSADIDEAVDFARGIC